MAKISEGMQAPRFELSSTTGERVSLSALLEKGPVVVFFYPKDDTPGCTKEACTFRDSYEAFQAAGASVVGISSDSTKSHQRFADKHGFPFLLLADEGGRVRSEFGVPKTLGLIDGRSTYVIDKQGVVRGVFHSQLQVTRHAHEALETVRSLAKAS
ncbi:MAG: peroxiredoxin [Polyangiaceae bacterium]